MKKVLTDEHSKILNVLEEKMNERLRTNINSCVHCCLCETSCHYSLTSVDPKYIPANKVARLTTLYRRYYTITGKLFPKWFGAEEVNDETIREMIDVLFGACTLCGRCAKHCSTGVDVPYLVRTGRMLLTEIGKTSPGLKSTVDTAIITGNNMGIPKEDLVDTLVWLEEDLRMEVEDNTASIPLDRKDARIMYTLNPREPKFFPLSISAIAKIFHIAKEDWTISTKSYDVTNYSYFAGDEVGAKELVSRLYDEATGLGVETVVLAECGHGFRAFRWEGPNWMKKKYPFRVISAVELLAEYIRTGRIKPDKTKYGKSVTLHDPCNLVRNGGVIEEQRYVLKNAVSEFIEMIPNRTDNFCCGGGGGQLSMSEYAQRRLEAGKIKAEQIRKTGAKVVATPCHNCIDQLMELNSHYKLGVEIKTIGEIVAEALV
ncbi:MAG: (Fe-S)-binding protein [Bacteroidetes bacterium]|nr:(Fe-S)-binding protein [Bacteroidota bacterium]